MVTDTALNPPSLAEGARARAAMYSFLSGHFTTLPDVLFVERLRGPQVAAMLSALAADDGAGPDITGGAAQMSSFLDATRAEAPAQLAEKLGIERTRLYRGITPTYGPPPPYEMVWSRTAQDVKLLQALARQYRQLGLAPSADVIERLDYIGVELDCMRELALREAAAWEAGTPDVAHEVRAAQQAFLDEHLAGWVPSYVEKGLEHATTEFYQGHLLMLRGFIASEQQGLAQPLG